MVKRGNVVGCFILFWRRGLTGGCKKVQCTTGTSRSWTVKTGCNPGSEPVLLAAVEDRLVSYIIEMSDMGLGSVVRTSCS